MPDVINLGALQVNTVNNNAMVTIGDASNGDTFKYQKFNMGFGVIFGSLNMITGNINLLYDPDVGDQNGSIPVLKPDFSNSITASPFSG